MDSCLWCGKAWTWRIGDGDKQSQTWWEQKRPENGDEGRNIRYGVKDKVSVSRVERDEVERRVGGWTKNRSSSPPVWVLPNAEGVKSILLYLTSTRGTLAHGHKLLRTHRITDTHSSTGSGWELEGRHYLTLQLHGWIQNMVCVYECLCVWVFVCVSVCAQSLMQLAALP